MPALKLVRMAGKPRLPSEGTISALSQQECSEAFIIQKKNLLTNKDGVD